MKNNSFVSNKTFDLNVSCLIDTKTPGGEVNYMMTRLYPGLELPQFQELTTKKQEQVHPGTED